MKVALCVQDSDHNGKAEHKGPGDWGSAHPRVRFWKPEPAELLPLAEKRQAERGDVPSWVWPIARKHAVADGSRL